MGLISDTHGLLRPQALTALAGSDLVLHAGDVGKADILPRLSEIAPVRAVRGNTDAGGYAAELPASLTLPLEGLTVLMHHGHLPLADDRLSGCQVVIQGHSHKPSLQRHEGRLYVNPGSAGPRRFRLPVTLGLLRIDGDEATAELVDLQSAGGPGAL